MEELIESKFQETFGNKIPIAKEWLYDFMDFFEKQGCSKEQLQALVDTLLSRKNLENMRKGDFLRDTHSIKNEKAFFQYLESIKSKITPEYLNQGINYSLENINESNNLIDSFIKYIVATNFEDIIVKSSISEMKEIGDEKPIRCYLGEFLLCRAATSMFDEERIDFDELHTRKNLTGLKIGSVLFKEMMKEVHESFPDKDLFAWRVMQSNVGGIRFYERMGGEFFHWENPDEIIPAQEIDNSLKDNICVIYRKEKLKELSEVPTEPPRIEISQVEKKEKPKGFIDKIKALFNKIKRNFEKQKTKALPESTVANKKTPEKEEADRQKLIYEIRGTSMGQTYTYDNAKDTSNIHELNNSKYINR